MPDIESWIYPSHHHRFLLRPVLCSTGVAEVLMCTERGVEGVVPRPGTVRGTRVDLWGVVEVAWSAAHSQLLFNFVGWNRCNVAVARPQGGTMWLTVIEEVVADRRRVS